MKENSKNKKLYSSIYFNDSRKKYKWVGIFLTICTIFLLILGGSNYYANSNMRSIGFLIIVLGLLFWLNYFLVKMKFVYYLSDGGICFYKHWRRKTLQYKNAKCILINKDKTGTGKGGQKYWHRNSNKPCCPQP